jgi:hypothetical protein
MSNEPTPRTDSKNIEISTNTIKIHTNYVSCYFARKLERELAKATKQRDALAEALRKLTEYDLGDIPVGIVRKCNETLQSLTTNEL